MKDEWMMAKGSTSIIETQITCFKLVNYLINSTALIEFLNIALKDTDNLAAFFLKGHNDK